MYDDAALRRAQHYLDENPDSTFWVVHNPDDPPPALTGNIDFATSPYMRRGNLLVIDRDDLTQALLRHLRSDTAATPLRHEAFGVGQ